MTLLVLFQNPSFVVSISWKCNLWDAPFRRRGTCVYASAHADLVSEVLVYGATVFGGQTHVRARRGACVRVTRVPAPHNSPVARPRSADGRWYPNRARTVKRIRTGVEKRVAHHRGPSATVPPGGV